MKPGGRLSLYLSQAVAADINALSERYPGLSAPQLVRRAIGALADEAVAELVERDARESEEVAYGRVVWN